MTLSTLTSRANYPGAGSVGPFAVPFRVRVATDLLVTIRAANGDETTLVNITDYTVGGVGNASATVTLVAALAVGQTLSIRRAPPLTQPTSIKNQAAYFSATHEEEFDLLVMQQQAMKDQLDRSFGVSESYDPAGMSLRLKGETGTILGWLDDETLGNLEVPTTATGYALLTGEVGVTDLTYPWLHARRYGIAGDGSNEKTKIQFLLTTLAAIGAIADVIFPPGDYNVGNLAASAIAFTVTGVPNINIVGPGARFVCNTTDDTVTRIWHFVNCKRLRVDMRGYDTGYNRNTTWHGAHLVSLYATSLSGSPIAGPHVLTLDAEHMLSALVVDGDAGADRITNFTLNITSRDTYYGPNFQNNGDNVRGVVYCQDPRRAYFPYGVEDHDVTLRVEGTATGIGSNACIPIDRFGGKRDTKNIKLRVSFSGICLWTTLVKLTHIDAAGAGAEWIDDIDLTINVDRAATIGGGTLIFQVAAETILGVAQTTTLAHFNRIRLGGNAFNATIAAISIATVQATEGIIALDPTLSFTNMALPDWPGFVLKTAPDKEIRTISNNITAGGRKIIIPLANFDGLPFTMRVVTRMRDGGLAAANSTYREDIIDGWNASGGAVGIVATNLHTITRNTACVPTFTATGETIEITFAGAPYNSANAFAQVEVEYGTPRRAA